MQVGEIKKGHIVLLSSHIHFSLLHHNGQLHIEDRNIWKTDPNPNPKLAGRDVGRKEKRGALEAHLNMLGENPSPVFLVCFGAKLNVPYTNYVGKVKAGSPFIKH